MKLSIALVTALIGAVTAFPADPLPDVSIADRSVDLLTKRDCASGFLCKDAGAKLCKCNQGMHCTCTFIPGGSPGGTLGYYAWLCWDCPKPANGGLQCINGACNRG
ncbi:uncharacterized protein K460DRAFT_397499 [Cucurbitaria berberidis CBS 394.84]|uniref:Uncharacterized protein n=1 Tax=Cucurbitaria berberidis CBS 394.84 TaxID=1168544 RepID=A0A9P4GFM9_9PLEO|nr:uncharacterized protein K460DRAFT_397499 [Cucurbitaria berberidis CBS 394.84]KAF1844391.1 hypothetical protein K460DRAFT_397499 [Cucurbitaria berberidis CBS 394.84]